MPFPPATILPMTSRAKKRFDVRNLQLTGDARRGYTYFITGSVANGYTWELVTPDDHTLCSTMIFDTKAECLKSLRTVQRHAGTTHVLDETR